MRWVTATLSGRSAAVALAAAVCSLVLSTSAVSTQHLSRTQFRDLTNLQDELARCAAFFYISSAVLYGDERAPEFSEQSMLAYVEMIKSAQIAAESLGLMEETTIARFSMSVDEIMELIGYDTANYSIVLHRFGGKCRTLRENYIVRFRSILE